MSKVRGKVAKIISPTEIAINLGEQHGVEVGNFAWVQEVIEVTDPDSKESLGSVLATKLTLKVTLVLPKMAVGMITDNVEPSGSGLGLFPSRKRATDRSQEVDRRTVLVRIGAPVTIETKEADEPPF